MVITLGHRHRLIAGEVVDLLYGDAGVEHSCDDAMVEIGGADVAKPSSVAPAARSGLPADGGRYRRPIRVRTGRQSRGAGGEWPARSRVGRGLIPVPYIQGVVVMDIVKGVIDKVASLRLITRATFMKPFSIRQAGTVTSY